MATALTTRLTAEEFAERYAEVPFCELVRGEVLNLSPGAPGHSSAVSNAHDLLSAWAKRTKCGRALTAEVGLITQRGPDTVRGADVAYFSYQRLPKGRLPDGFFTVPPELVIEVIGKGQGRESMREKAAEYLRMGVERVWVIDPRARTVEIFRPGTEAARLNEGDLLRDEAILPGFSCTVADFFED